MINAVLYTDGSATMRPDGTFYCGYAYVIVTDGEPIIGKAFPGVGTINQAEMCAVYAGMQDAIDHGIDITEVYTDSTYVINGLLANMDKYDRNEWTNSHGSEVINKEMWINLIEFSKRTGKVIPAVHVKGHTGHPFNELCDKLAKEAAMSQKPVVDFMNVRKCEDLGFHLPAIVEPVPLPPSPGEPVHVKGELVKALSKYTDDRSKCCFINYPGIMHAVVSKGLSYWKTSEGSPTTDELAMTYKVHPVVTEDGAELPLYRYMTESGTPLSVVLNSANVMWQGEDFVSALIETMDAIVSANYPIPNADLIIASYNLASAKKYQGIYLSSYSPSGGKIETMYRTERMPQGKCMRIPYAYIEGILDMLDHCEDAAVGLITNTTMLGLVITGSEGGILVGSSVIPHTITIDDSLMINMDKPEKPNVRFLDIAKAHQAMEVSMKRVIPGADLASVIPAQNYERPAATETPDEVSEATITPTYYGDILTDIDEVKIVRSEKPSKSDIIKEYMSTVDKMKELLDRQKAIIDGLMSNEYPVLTPELLAEIEAEVTARVRADMISKFNDMFK